MSALHDLAAELGTHERTLRRGLSTGLLHGRRPSPRRVELALGEPAYLRRHWSLIAALREALRKEPRVRLAVLIGSAARGELREDSDIDLLVHVVDDDWRARERLRARLADATARPVDLVPLEAARQDPLLLDAALHEGRVLVDRDRSWAELVADRERIAVAAHHARGDLRDELHGLISEIATGR